MSHTITHSPITTPTDVKAYAKRRYLNFDYSVRYTDAVLTDMIEGAQKDIETLTGHLFNAQTVTQKWHGEELNGGTLLQLQFYPILLTEEDGGSDPTLTIDDTEKTLDTDYYVTDENVGTINTESYLPTTGYNNVVLEYTAGQIRSLTTAKELCEAIVVYTMLMERETPPSLQNIIDQTQTGVYNKGTDKTDKVIQFSFDIEQKFQRLPRKIFHGIIGG